MNNDEFTEQEIDVAQRYLKYFDSENESRENAIALLSDIKMGYRKMSHENPNLLLELQEKIDKKESEN